MTDLYLKDLGNYSNGTDQIYKDRLTGIKYSDGVKYIMANGYAWFISDALAVIKVKPKVRVESFLTVKLNILPEDSPHRASLTIDDGGKNGNSPKILHRQYYDWSDAKVSIKLFYENGILMLPDER